MWSSVMDLYIYPYKHEVVRIYEIFKNKSVSSLNDMQFFKDLCELSFNHTHKMFINTIYIFIYGHKSLVIIYMLFNAKTRMYHRIRSIKIIIYIYNPKLPIVLRELKSITSVFKGWIRELYNVSVH